MEVDFSRLDFGTAQKVDEILRGRYDRALHEAMLRQREIAYRNCLQPPRARDGFGERTFEIDPVIDAHWRQCYGHDYTSHRDLMKFLIRRNEEIQVRSLRTKVVVGWEPNKRETRRYPSRASCAKAGGIANSQ